MSGEPWCGALGTVQNAADLLPPGPADPERASSPPATVLVVDDEASLVDLLSDALGFAGYRVLTARDGGAALTSARLDAPDLLVLDVNLPDVDGFEVCRTLRREGNDVPVIFLTARDDPDGLRTGFARGGDDYLTKPFSLAELRYRIEAVLRRSRRAPEPAPVGDRISVADIVMDVDGYRVWRGDREVELSATEFRLLRYLMLNQNRVLSRDQILDHVWNYDFGGESQIVATYVSYLRRKLGDPDLIRTVRGIGYSIRAEGA